MAKFNFGLDAFQEERAGRLHAEAIIFDMVSMYAGGNIFKSYPEEVLAQFRESAPEPGARGKLFEHSVFWPFEVALNGSSDLLWQWLRQSGLTCGAYDIDLPFYGGGDPLAYEWEKKLERYSELPWLRFVTTAGQIRNAKRDGAVALYAFYQPVIPVLRDLSVFEPAHRRGLRSFMLTYNRMDHVGVGCMERVDAGLSRFGLDVVDRCNELGIIIDVSHCGPQTTLDACRHSKKPVTANHTCARGLFNHPRGKTDDALKAVAATGGVVGVLAVPYFLSSMKNASVKDMLDHIDYITDLIGPQHVGLGTDWPMQAPDEVLLATFGSEAHTKEAGWGADYRRDVTQKLIGFSDCRDLSNITRGLVKRGYSDRQILGILGENALRVFQQVCG